MCLIVLRPLTGYQSAITVMVSAALPTASSAAALANFAVSPQTDTTRALTFLVTLQILAMAARIMLRGRLMRMLHGLVDMIGGE